MTGRGIQPNMCIKHYKYKQHTHALSPSLSLSLSHTHTRTHARTHARTHTHTNTHTHTHQFVDFETTIQIFSRLHIRKCKETAAIVFEGTIAMAYI